MLSLLLTAIIILATLFFLGVTLLPFTDSHAWWIQGMEFPRIHYVLLLGPLILLTFWVMPPGGWLLLAAQLGCLGYQGWRILPYTPLVPKEITFVDPGAAGDTITVMSSNVLMENTRYDDVGRAIARADPDVLFLMETDRRWSEALEPWLAGYPHVLRHPKDNYYGLIVATRLKVHDLRVEYLTVDDTPTAFAELETPGGQVFRFLGLHPKPPTPGVDTKDRDAQLYYSARFARDSDLPVVVMGDFNAVAWSHVAQRFKAVGHYLDPRIGRGPIPSFDAEHRIMRFPIDQLYITEEIAMVSFDRGPNVGSDHFPMSAHLLFDKGVADRMNRRAKALTPSEDDSIARMIDLHAERLAQVRRDSE